MIAIFSTSSYGQSPLMLHKRKFLRETLGHNEQVFLGVLDGTFVQNPHWPLFWLSQYISQKYILYKRF
jgi:hypothetical protein